MNKFILLLFITISSSNLFSQASCGTAMQLCYPYNYNASTGQSITPDGADYGCLYSIPNTNWYYIQINNSGSLDILIEGQIADSTGYDVDFICWGPFTTMTNACTNLTANDIVDCSYSGSYTETLNIPNGLVGQHYIVLITNYANINQNIIFSQQNGTGSFGCVSTNVIKTICSGSNAAIIASNAANLASPVYSIQPGGMTDTTGLFTVSPAVSTSYTLFCTGINAINTTTTTSSTVQVNVLLAPMILISTSNNSLCAGESATLQASGATSYNWNTGSTSSFIVVSPATTTTYSVSGNDGSCSADSSIVEYVETCVTGIKSLSKSEDISLYPNPTSGLFTIRTSTSARITISNIVGEIIFDAVKMEGSFPVNLQNNANGLYIVQIIRNGAVSNYKILKQ